MDRVVILVGTLASVLGIAGAFMQFWEGGFHKTLTAVSLAMAVVAAIAFWVVLNPQGGDNVTTAKPPISRNISQTAQQPDKLRNGHGYTDAQEQKRESPKVLPKPSMTRVELNGFKMSTDVGILIELPPFSGEVTTEESERLKEHADMLYNAIIGSYSRGGHVRPEPGESSKKPMRITKKHIYNWKSSTYQELPFSDSSK